MFISAQLVDHTFALLRLLDEGEGKSRQEKVSAIRYLLATSRMLKAIDQDTLALETGESENRSSFTAAVGEVVAIRSTPSYTLDFHARFRADSGIWPCCRVYVSTLRAESHREYPSKSHPQES